MSVKGSLFGTELVTKSMLGICFDLILLIVHWYSVWIYCIIYWSQVRYACISNFATIGTDNRLSPGRHQAIIGTNAGILFIRNLGRSFTEIKSEIHTFSFKKIHLKMSSAKWRPFCLDLNVLKPTWISDALGPTGQKQRIFYFIFRSILGTEQINFNYPILPYMCFLNLLLSMKSCNNETWVRNSVILFAKWKHRSAVGVWMPLRYSVFRLSWQHLGFTSIISLFETLEIHQQDLLLSI